MKKDLRGKNWNALVINLIKLMSAIFTNIFTDIFSFKFEKLHGHTNLTLIKKSQIFFKKKSEIS